MLIFVLLHCVAGNDRWYLNAMQCVSCMMTKSASTTRSSRRWKTEYVLLAWFANFA